MIANELQVLKIAAEDLGPWMVWAVGGLVDGQCSLKLAAGTR